MSDIGSINFESRASELGSRHKENHTGNGGRSGSAGIARYVVVVLIIVYIVLLMIFKSGSTKPYAEIEQTVENALNTENIQKVSAQGLKRYYGLNAADYEGVMLYTAVSSLSVEEVLLIKVKEESQVKEVRAAIEERLESRKNDFEGYAPEQAQLIEQAKVSVRGKYIFLAVSADAEKYSGAFAGSL